MYSRLPHHIFSLGRFLAVFALLVLVMVEEGYGQRVYANSYGADESGVAIPLLIAAGRVFNPTNAIEPNSTSGNSTELRIGGLLGSAYATYQMEFVNNEGNLPSGTSIYVRLDDNTTKGILGLALATQGFVSVYNNANSNNIQTTNTPSTLTGLNVPLSDSDVVPLIIDGQQYLRITPVSCFNAIRFSITSDGLLGLLTDGNIRIYHAYYECPVISIHPPNPICEGETTTLAVSNPSTCGEYRWYVNESGGEPIATGITFTTPELFENTVYYVAIAGVDSSECGRTPVSVTVLPQPGKPHLTITDVQN